MVHEKQRVRNPLVKLYNYTRAAVGKIINPIAIDIPTDTNVIIDALNGTVQPTATMLLQYDAVRECWVPFKGGLFSPVVATIAGSVAVTNTNLTSLSCYDRRFNLADVQALSTSGPAWHVVSGGFDTYLRRTLCDVSGQSFYIRLGGYSKVLVPAYTLFVIDWFCGELAIMQASGSGDVAVCVYRAAALVP